MKRTPLKRKTPLKRGKALRKESERRAKLRAVVNPGRKGFVLLAEVCMVCKQAEATDPHEICRGSSREECLKHPRLWLALCRRCHDAVGDYSLWPIERQIACRIEWETRQTIFEANDIRGRAQTAMTYEEVKRHL